MKPPLTRQKPVIVAWHIALTQALILPLMFDQGYRVTDIEVPIMLSISTLGILPFALVANRYPFARRVSFSILGSCLAELYFAAHTTISTHLFALFLWTDNINIIDPSLIATGFILIFIWSACLTRFEFRIYAATALFATFFTLSAALLSYKPLLSPVFPSDTRLTTVSESHLPLVVHFIIDEQGSPMGLLQDSAAGKLLAPYVKRGFAAQ